MSRNSRIPIIIAGGLAALVGEAVILNHASKEENKDISSQDKTQDKTGHYLGTLNPEKSKHQLKQNYFIHPESREIIVFKNNQPYILGFHNDGKVKLTPYKQK